MRAVVIDHFGGPDSLAIKDVPEPEPKPGYVVIQEKAFRINHAEMHMRRGEWAEAAQITGIECGLVKSCPVGEFAVGSKVAALMGGLGRTINGSYAEFTRAPVTGVAPIESDLPWEELAVIPESYATAWTCLFRNLELTKGQTLVIRGAMSAFGQAALNMAVEAGAKVIGTTRNVDRSGKLEELGAHRLEVEAPDLSKRMPEAKEIDAVLDLVGNSTILLLADLGVTKTHSRPHVSNDNPFSEAQFKTLKYRPDFPARFGSIQDARAHCHAFFGWYNTEHHHSGLGLLTPADVHHGLAEQRVAARAAVLATAYATHPERFPAGLPQPPGQPSEVWINPPKRPLPSQTASTLPPSSSSPLAHAAAFA